MFLVYSVFRVAPENIEGIDHLYRNREHLVDNFEGFISTEAFRTETDPCEFTLMARWENRQSYEAYRQSQEFISAHRKMMGLMQKVQVQPGSHSIKYLEYLAS